MDVYQRVPTMPKSQRKGYNGKKKNRGDNPLKVVYISSPMKVTTSASRFRALVQQLTGKDSDISQYMDNDDQNFGASREFHHEVSTCSEDRFSAKEASKDRIFSSGSSEDVTPTSSESFLGPTGENYMFGSQSNKEQFTGSLWSSSFCDPCQLDVLGSYDGLF